MGLQSYHNTCLFKRTFFPGFQYQKCLKTFLAKIPMICTCALIENEKALCTLEMMINLVNSRI